MPNYISYQNDWWKLSDDATKAAIEIVNIQALTPAQISHANVLTQISNQDASVKQPKLRESFKLFQEVRS